MFDPNRRWTANLDELQREMERYVRHMAQKKPRLAAFSQRAWQPAADLYETENAVVALVELAGVRQDEIELVVARNALTIRGERKDHGEGGERRYSQLEIPFGPFERTLHFSTAVNPDTATASFQSGLLQVVMPRMSASAPRRVVVSEE
jgi:HSP20 family protein